MKTRELPEWWPDWMSEPTTFPLGTCRECGAQQYPMQRVESHMFGCSRFEPIGAHRRRVSWPVGLALIGGGT